MSAPEFVIREGDLEKELRRVLQDENGDAVDLTGIDSVRVRVTHLDGDLTLLEDMVVEGDATLGTVVYQWVLGDTATPGIHLGEIIVDYDGGSNFQTFPNEGYIVILVSARGDTIPAPRAPLARDLCTLSDVVSYVPAYNCDVEQTNAKLRALITAESALIEERSGREIVGLEDTQPAPRRFALNRSDAWVRRVDVGDLASTDALVVKVLGRDGEELETVPAGAIRSLYAGRQSPERSWEPITALEFPRAFADSPSLQWGYELEITGTWGFAEIPTFIREAVAKRVILRYVNDVAEAGDLFSEAAGELNLAAMFASSEDAIEAIGGGIVLA